jgi:two-component system, cell cycle sensor histidine kinase and response regulator CckA
MGFPALVFVLENACNDQERSREKRAMTERTVHKLLSGLTAVLPVDELERKRAAQASSQRETDSGISAYPAPQIIIYTRKCDGRCETTFMSENVSSQLGYKPEEFIQNPSLWEENIHLEDGPTVLDTLSKVSELQHQIQEYRFRHQDGSYRWVRDELTLIRDADGQPIEILGSLLDVTEQRRKEEALRQSEARYRSLVESSPVGMMSFDARGEITGFNPAVLSILGVPASQVGGPLDLFSIVPMAEAGLAEAILHCLESGQPTTGEFEYKSKENRVVCTKLHVVPTRDSARRITGAHAFVQDISDQKRAEELIVRSERLKVLGQISAGVGHTFSNLLQIVSGNANIGLTNLDLEEYDGIRVNLEQILKSTRSATESVRWLQQFARERPHRSAVRTEVLDLTEAVEEAVEVCKLWSKAEQERKKIEISYEVDLAPGCWVEGVVDQLAWVVLNLLKNAVEALPKGGRIRVKTQTSKDQVMLTVQDNGVGIRSQDIRNITTAFWTSKDAHAGVGLAFNCGILRQHSGTMGVKRMKPRGTTFTVRLPFIYDPSQKRQALAQEASKRGSRILFIDDDEAVVKIFENGFTALGQTVYPALTGAEGLGIIEENEIDAVVCDLAMAGMNGWEVARAISEMYMKRAIVRPPFIMLTGWAGQLPEDEILAHPEVDRIVQKPIKIPALLEVITSAIDRSSKHTTFSGTVEGIDLLEYMQLMILNGKPVVVEVLLKNGMRGLIFLDRGRFLHATCGDLEGETAVYHCLNFAGGSFSNLPWCAPDRMTIDKPGDYILIEAARRRDETRSESKVVPSDPGAPEEPEVPTTA